MATRSFLLFPSRQAVLGLLLGIFVPLVLAGFVRVAYNGGLSDQPTLNEQAYIIE